LLGEDVCSGPGQDVCPAPDGLGDTPYVLDADSLDLYPLMILPGSSIDKLPPLVNIISPRRADVINTPSATVTGTASDGDSGLRRVEVRVNNGSWTIAGGTSSWSATVPFPSGYDILEARAWDHAGNVSATRQVIVIQLNPTAPVTVVTDKEVYQPGEIVQFAVVASNLDSTPMTLYFSSSCQSFFAVEDSLGVTVYDARTHVACFAVSTWYTLQPGQSKADLWGWQQVDDAGTQVPFPADYVIRGIVPSIPAPPDGSKTISLIP
jgi:hypothetical protein